MAKPIDYARRDSFDSFVEAYDRHRPSYPLEMYQALFTYAGLKQGAQALEIGIGTGHATEPFLKRGCQVTAVEIGKRLAQFSRERFQAYPNLNVVNTSFEELQEPDDRFDIIYAASSFHWIPEEIGYPKALKLLKPGGTFAMFWNRHFVNRPDDALHCKIQEIYDRYMPEKRKHIEYDQERYGRKLTTLEGYGFREGAFHLFHSMSLFDADEYISLINTYSDHIMMPQPQKDAMQGELRKAVEDSGNRLNVYDTLELYLGKK